MHKKLNSSDSLWVQLKREASEIRSEEPLLAEHLQASILDRDSLADALSNLLSEKLATQSLAADALWDLFLREFVLSSAILSAVRSDLLATIDRDPASRGVLNPFLNYKGFHSLEAYRACHSLWLAGRKALACHLQGRISEVFAVDIHPAANIGRGVFIDHGTSVVIGETAIVGDDVSILQDVTLGGTGKVGGDRHPKVGKGVLIGAGAKILGNIRVGEGAKIGAGSVVLRDVLPHTTVVGIPAKPIGYPKSRRPALQMEHNFDEDVDVSSST